MSDTIKKITLEGSLVRFFSADIRAMGGDDSREVELSFSSEDPYERYYGFEVLGHKEGEVRTNRLNEAAPLLFNHDRNAHIGRVMSSSIKDGKGKAIVKFSNSKIGQEKFQDVKDGILKEVSVGYRIHKMELIEKRDDAPSTYRAVDWEPLEISLVTVPVDATVGVGRSAHEPNTVTINQKSETKNITMSEPITTPEAKPAFDLDAVRREALQGERTRIDSLRNAVQRAQRGGFVVANDVLATAERDGWTAEKLNAHIIDNQPERKPSARHVDVDLGEIETEGKRKYSLARALSLLVQGKSLDGIEAEVQSELLKRNPNNNGGLLVPSSVFYGQRDALAGDFDAGGSLVHTTHRPGVIPFLENAPVLQRAGATMLTGLTGPVSLDRDKGQYTASWVAEGAAGSEQTLSTGATILSPKALSAYSNVSKQLLLTASVDVESWVRNKLTTATNRAIDLAGLEGTGVSGQPKGLFSQATGTSANQVRTVTFGGSATWADVVEFETDIEAANGDVSRMAFITSPQVAGKWKTTSKDTGSGLFLADTNNTANGYQIYKTNQLITNANYVAFGCWDQCLIAMFGPQEITVNPYSLDTTGKVRITMLSHADIGFEHLESFAVSTDAGNQ